MQNSEEIKNNYILKRSILFLPRLIEPLTRRIETTATTAPILCEEGIAEITFLKETVDCMYETAMREIKRHADEEALKY